VSSLRVAALQHDIVWEDRDATLAHLGPWIARAVGAGGRLIVLTEMFATGFSMATHLTAEPIDGPTVTWLRERATEHDAWLAGSVPLTDPDHELPTNALLVAGPDGTLHRYDKLHPFSYAGEHERFRPGDAPVIVEVDGLRLGLSVCYDLRFADLYWSRAADVHAELLVANWPAARVHHWRTLVEARAIENQVYVVAVNRVGSGGTLEYDGHSRVVAPDGQLLAAASGRETILLAELDTEVVADVRERLPFLPDRRGW
jgi:predicted amidohydrolase